MGPIQSKYRDYNRIEMAGTLDSVERAMQDLIAGVALIPPEPADDALRRWRVLFITYRRLIEQMRPEDPALGEIADYLVSIETERMGLSANRAGARKAAAILLEIGNTVRLEQYLDVGVVA